MTTLTEARHAGGFIVSEANGYRSREKITVLSGQDLAAGAVLGAVNTGTAAATAFAGNTGNGAMGAITVGTAAKAGAHKLTVIEPASNAGAFIVEGPDGVAIGVGDVGTEFDAGGLTFTLADGGTDFAAGDGFTIAVAVSATKYKEYDPSNTDGSEVAVAVLFDAVDASGGDVEGAAVVRDAEVNAEELGWFSGATSDEKTAGAADLARAGIVVRASD